MSKSSFIGAAVFATIAGMSALGPIWPMVIANGLMSLAFMAHGIAEKIGERP